MQDNRPIDMQALRVFVATAEDCNMSKAAERLGISQPAVSQSIRLLEENFGAPLLNRSARPLTLTPAGIALLNRGRVLLEEALNLRGAVIEASQGIKPSLRIGLVDSFASTCGTPLVQQLLRTTTQLSVRTGLTPNLGEALARRELDLVISSRSLDLDGMANHALMSERFLAIAPKSSAPVSSAADLAALARALPIVRFNQQSHLGEQVERALRRMRLSLPRRLEVDTADTLTSMVAGGIGWAITTPLCLLQGSRSASSVRHHVVTELTAERTVYLHARRGEYGSLAQDTFEVARLILEGQTLRELKAINPVLSKIIRIHPWSESA
jgi:DNA-binding transcriptional LysR family regulator